MRVSRIAERFAHISIDFAVPVSGNEAKPNRCPFVFVATLSTAEAKRRIACRLGQALTEFKRSISVI